MPLSFNHLVLTSSRRVPFCMILPYQSCPSRPKNQLINTLVALGWGGSLMIPNTTKELLSGKPSFVTGACLNGRPAVTKGYVWLCPQPHALATLELACAACRRLN